MDHQLLANSIQDAIQNNILNSLEHLLTKQTLSFLEQQETKRNAIFQKLMILHYWTKSNVQELFLFIDLFLDVKNAEHAMLISELNNVLLSPVWNKNATVILVHEIFRQSREYLKNKESLKITSIDDNNNNKSDTLLITKMVVAEHGLFNKRQTIGEKIRQEYTKKQENPPKDPFCFPYHGGYEIERKGPGVVTLMRIREHRGVSLMAVKEHGFFHRLKSFFGL